MGIKSNRLPVMAVNLYSALGIGQSKFDAQPVVMQYIVATLKDVLISDYACPCELGYDAGDVMRFAHISQVTHDPSDSSGFDPVAYAKIKSAILSEGSLRKIAKDVVSNYKSRCLPDQPVSIYFIGGDICVGFRMEQTK